MAQINEKRKEKRHVANPKLKVMGQEFEVKNLSLSGIGFYYEGEMQIGESHNINLHYPPEEGMLGNIDVSLNMIIRYCGKEESSGRNVIGAEFKGLSESKKIVINNLIEFLKQFNSYWGIDWEK
ncbi:MAG: PilZ domain-containing protein [bacterium]